MSHPISKGADDHISLELDSIVPPAPSGGARIIDLRRRRRTVLDVDVVGAAADSASALVARPRVLLAPSWIVLFVGDVVGLTAPGWFGGHGRFELLAMAAVSVVLFHSGGLYRPKLRLSVLDDAPALAIRTISAAAIVTVITAVIGFRPVVDDFLVLAGLAIAGQLIVRTLAVALIRHARATGRVNHRTLVIGGGEVAARMTNHLVHERAYGLSPVGFLDRRTRTSDLTGVPHLGETANLARVIDETSAAVVIVAFSSETEAEIVDVLRETERSGCDVFVVPRLFELHNYGQTDHIGAVPVVRLLRPRLNRSAWFAKRAFDVVVSGLVLFLLSPLLLAIALAVRIDGGPGVIFRQTRVGLDGRLFELMKFRSLRPVDETESATRWSVADDDRMSTVGRILRRTSVDELPQLINVLRGEMTLVGPRPERPHFVETFTGDIPGYRHRHRVAAGLTGLAQVSGLRGDTSIVDRSRYDNFYIENWSMWLDLKIICTTVREVVGARGR